MWICLLHSDEQFEKLPSDAVQIGSKQGKAQTIKFSDGSIHQFKRQSCQAEPGSLEFHRHWHKKRPSKNCRYCQHDAEPTIIPFEPEVAPVATEEPVYDYNPEAYPINPDDWFWCRIVKHRTNFSIGQLENNETVLIPNHYPVGSEKLIRMIRQHHSEQYPFKAVQVEEISAEVGEGN